eukprot:m.75237 g.75237  ORF g.75237 m.75237 type:complete len:236 (-) comp7807_c0_seq2:202-909(-)
MFIESMTSKVAAPSLKSITQPTMGLPSPTRARRCGMFTVLGITAVLCSIAAFCTPDWSILTVRDVLSSGGPFECELHVDLQGMVHAHVLNRAEEHTAMMSTAMLGVASNYFFIAEFFVAAAAILTGVSVAMHTLTDERDDAIVLSVSGAVAGAIASSVWIILVQHAVLNRDIEALSAYCEFHVSRDAAFVAGSSQTLAAIGAACAALQAVLGWRARGGTAVVTELKSADSSIAIV